VSGRRSTWPPEPAGVSRSTHQFRTSKPDGTWQRDHISAPQGASREGRREGVTAFSAITCSKTQGCADFDISGCDHRGAYVYVSYRCAGNSNAQNPIVSGSFDPSLTISK
jgi:hypothetical protein